MTVLAILPTDQLFRDSPDAGDERCLCSRCKERIRADQVPVRLFMEDGAEYRFHMACVCMDEPDADVDEGGSD